MAPSESVPGTTGAFSGVACKDEAGRKTHSHGRRRVVVGEATAPVHARPGQTLRQRERNTEAREGHDASGDRIKDEVIAGHYYRVEHRRRPDHRERVRPGFPR